MSSFMNQNCLTSLSKSPRKIDARTKKVGYLYRKLQQEASMKPGFTMKAAYGCGVCQPKNVHIHNVLLFASSVWVTLVGQQLVNIQVLPTMQCGP